MAESAALATNEEVRLVALPCHRDDKGWLAVLEGGQEVPFVIARVFIVHASPGVVRGQHAHKQCAQFLTCTAGSVEVMCDDGASTVTHRLDRADVGLLVPAGIWSQQTYLAPGSSLTVLCDRPYEAADYLRDYAEFLAFRDTESGS